MNCSKQLWPAPGFHPFSCRRPAKFECRHTVRDIWRPMCAQHAVKFRRMGEEYVRPVTP